MNKRILIPILIVLIFFILFRSKVHAPTKERKSAITEESASTSARIPQGWQTYQDGTLGFSVSYPPGFELTQNGYHSVMVVKKVPQPGQGPTNFIYISTIIEGDQNKDGQIYNFNKSHLESLVTMKVNEEKPVAGEAAALEQFVKFKRLPDTTISGNTAMAFVNMKPWEFPNGTKEYRYLVHQKDRSYLIGGYLSTVDNNAYSIPEDLYNQIISTIKLPVNK